MDLVRIEWPSGNVQELTDVAPNQMLTIKEAVHITPTSPSASLNGSVTLTRTSVAGATYQWQFDGVDLAGQTNRTLNLTNIVADQQGHYSVVASNADDAHYELRLSATSITTFTKITAGPLVTDLGMFWGAPGETTTATAIRTCSSRATTSGTTALYHNNGDGTFSSRHHRCLCATAESGVWGLGRLRQ